MVASCREGPVVPLAVRAMTEAGAYDNPNLQTDDLSSDRSRNEVAINLTRRPQVDDSFEELDLQSDPAKVQAMSLEDGMLDRAGATAAGEDDDQSHPDLLTSVILRSRSTLGQFYKHHGNKICIAFKLILFLAYNAYLAASVLYAVVHLGGIAFCDGVGFLLIVTALAYVGVLYYKVLVPYLGDWSYRRVYTPTDVVLGQLWSKRLVRWALYVALVAAVVIYLVMDSLDESHRLISALGAVVLVLLCWVCSKHPGRVIWRHVLWGLGLQFTFGLAILRWEVGRNVFDCIGDKVETFLAYTNEGSKFVFGFLVSGKQFVFAFSVLPVIVFFSFCIQILYYYGVMQWIVIKLGWLLQVTVGTTACESLNAAANIFIGQSEAPLLVRPYLPILTKSELHAIMTGGFATIAGSVLAAYIEFGVSAPHLLSASVMSAPAALAVSKLVYPETERSKTTANAIRVEKGNEVNALDAASQGAMSVVKICGYIGASLIAFIAFISFVNGVLGWLGQLVGFQEAFAFPLTFEYLASLPLTPLAWLMGVQWSECGHLGELIAIKTVLNEFVAYSRLRDMIKQGLLSPRSITIATYALCGFSNFASMGIQISGLSALAPGRKSDLARLVFSAMISGNVACFLTACVAGALISDSATLADTAGVGSTAATLLANSTSTTATILANSTSAGLV